METRTAIFYRNIYYSHNKLEQNYVENKVFNRSYCYLKNIEFSRIYSEKIPYFEGLNIILKTFLLFGSKKGKEGWDGVSEGGGRDFSLYKHPPPLW